MLKQSQMRMFGGMLAVIWVLLYLLSGCGAPGKSPAPGGEAQVAVTTTDQSEQAHSAQLPQLNPVTLGAGEKLRVVATINLLGDIVKQVGGERIELTTLLPVGADPHTYSAAPADLRTLSAAHVVFMVGEGVEESMLSVLENREGESALVAVNTGIALCEMAEDVAGSPPLLTCLHIRVQTERVISGPLKGSLWKSR